MTCGARRCERCDDRSNRGTRSLETALAGKQPQRNEDDVFSYDSVCSSGNPVLRGRMGLFGNAGTIGLGGCRDGEERDAV
jgi:hypothetical protein